MPLYAFGSFPMPFQDSAETETQDCGKLESAQFSAFTLLSFVGKIDPKVESWTAVATANHISRGVEINLETFVLPEKIPAAC